MPDWWRIFFTGLIVDAQRRLNSERQTQEEADFLVEALAPVPGARIADVPCGNGRLALALAARGFALTGVDFTADLLDDARRSAAERNLQVTFLEGDMRELPGPAAFDHAFCFGNSFGYFDEAGNRRFLEAVCRALKPGGVAGFVQEEQVAEFVPAPVESYGSLKREPFQLGSPGLWMIGTRI